MKIEKEILVEAVSAIALLVLMFVGVWMCYFAFPGLFPQMPQ